MPNYTKEEKKIYRYIQKYLKGRGNGDGRYASYDYCYLYFHKYKNCLNEENLERSCLHLWAYLASWGMLRPRGKLFQKSLIVLTPIIEHFASVDDEIWHIDIDSYGDANIISKIIGEFQSLSKLLTNVGITPSVTLVTKIMLGVYGNIPAFDKNVRKAFSINTVNKNSLKRLYDEYQKHTRVYNQNIKVLEFCMKQSKYCYSKAKLLDMYGFQYGLTIK